TLMAATPEYGDALKAQGVVPYFIGVGPILAAKNTTRILMQLEQENALPDLILSIGSAGSAVLEQGSIYQVSQVSYRDMDASPFGFEKGHTPFYDYPAIISINAHINGLPSATLSTGASVIHQQGVHGKSFADVEAEM